MPTRLLLVAHAATSATRRGAFPNEEGLDDRGRAAVEAFAARLPSSGLLLSSPVRAAKDTAAILAVKSGLAGLKVEEDLRDLDVGAWAGRALTEIGEAGAEWIADPHFNGHGGESLAHLRDRVEGWLEASVANLGLTLGITHSAVIRAALLAVVDAPLNAFWSVDVPPLAMLALHSDGRRWAIRALETPDGAASLVRP